MRHHCSPWLTATLQALPYWWRFMQCLRKYNDGRKPFPDLVNALKYATAFPLVRLARLQLQLQLCETGSWNVCGLWLRLTEYGDEEERRR